MSTFAGMALKEQRVLLNLGFAAYPPPILDRPSQG